MKNNERIFITTVLLITGFGLSVDTWMDFKSNASQVHLIFELLLMFLSTCSVFLIWRDFSKLSVQVNGMNLELENIKSVSAIWRAEHQMIIEGLGAAIEKQLNKWGLSESEKEVAVYLLKGFSLKEIGEFRGGSEKTARQHASKVYEKSKLSGRAELSAFFMEDLLNPLNYQPSNGFQEQINLR